MTTATQQQQVAAALTKLQNAACGVLRIEYHNSTGSAICQKLAHALVALGFAQIENRSGHSSKDGKPHFEVIIRITEAGKVATL